MHSFESTAALSTLLIAEDWPAGYWPRIPQCWRRLYPAHNGFLQIYPHGKARLRNLASVAFVILRVPLWLSAFLTTEDTKLHEGRQPVSTMYARQWPAVGY